MLINIQYTNSNNFTLMNHTISLFSICKRTADFKFLRSYSFLRVIHQIVAPYITFKLTTA